MIPGFLLVLLLSFQFAITQSAFKATEDVSSLLKDINRERTIDKEWPFYKCDEHYSEFGVECPDYWHCERDSCLPDNPRFWEYQIAEIEELSYQDYFGNELGFKRITLVPFSEIMYKGESYLLKIYVRSNIDDIKEGLFLKLFPNKVDSSRYKIYIESLELHTETMEKVHVNLRE